jgi:hypothetical protein
VRSVKLSESGRIALVQEPTTTPGTGHVGGVISLVGHLTYGTTAMNLLDSRPAAASSPVEM